MKNRFDLEQEIMECWNVTTDINDVYEYVMNGDGSELSTDERDRVANILLGISQLYELKFNKLFNTFEECLSKREFHSIKTECNCKSN
jgi:hypothetical protein